MISREYQGVAWELKVDDTVITDRFLLIAVMNMELIGPRLHLAPNADPGDGYLDLVFVREADRTIPVTLGMELSVIIKSKCWV